MKTLLFTLLFIISSFSINVEAQFAPVKAVEKLTPVALPFKSLTRAEKGQRSMGIECESIKPYTYDDFTMTKFTKDQGIIMYMRFPDVNGLYFFAVMVGDVDRRVDHLMVMDKEGAVLTQLLGRVSFYGDAEISPVQYTVEAAGNIVVHKINVLSASYVDGFNPSSFYGQREDRIYKIGNDGTFTLKKLIKYKPIMYQKNELNNIRIMDGTEAVLETTNYNESESTENPIQLRKENLEQMEEPMLR